LNIKTLKVPLPDLTSVTVYWKRGEKRIDTKTKQVTKGQAVFNEGFAMKTVLDFNRERNEYLPKLVSSALSAKADCISYVYSRCLRFTKERVPSRSSTTMVRLNLTLPGMPRVPLSQSV
jgi:hypothetical protein